jgi:hypothetical protein
VGVDVDESGRNDLSGRVDGVGGLAFQWRATRPAATNLDDSPVFDGDVGLESVCTSSVDDGSASDFQIEHDYSLACPADTLQ